MRADESKEGLTGKGKDRVGLEEEGRANGSGRGGKRKGLSRARLRKIGGTLRAHRNFFHYWCSWSSHC